MTRIFLLSLLTFFFACNSDTGKQTAIKDRDYIMRKYFETVDSLPYSDTLDMKFKLLKAYHANDTGYLNASYKEVADLLKYRKEMLESHICEQLPPISTLNFEEVYRFSYEAAFCNKSVTLTIGKKSDIIIMETYLYEFNDKQTECKTISHTTKKLSVGDWNNLIDNIDYTDFWGLKEDNGRHGMDGSSLRITGYERPVNAFEGRYKTIYRWAGEQTAIGELFKKLLDNSGTIVDCFHY